MQMQFSVAELQQSRYSHIMMASAECSKNSSFKHRQKKNWVAVDVSLHVADCFTIEQPEATFLFKLF